MKHPIAHIRESDGAVQTLLNHNEKVAELAASFAEDFMCADVARVIGWLHDKGKEQSLWQQYLLSVAGGSEGDACMRQRPAHAYVGARIAQKLYPKLAPLIAQPIAGHHRGLYNYCDYLDEMKHELPSEVVIHGPMSVDLPKSLQFQKSDLHHLIRMLFSCLVDADSLDTEAFMQPNHARFRGGHDSMETLLEMLERHMEKLSLQTPDTEVNRVRGRVQQWCREESGSEIGFYSLTVPTGGGKTLASVLWALRHAIKNHLHRIIIAIPYTSIIVQTAATLKEILGEKNVLEHHSNFDSDTVKDEQMKNRLQLATENWDYPIVVTTNVQLFESLFSNRRSDCRKLHNIARSVIVLDEVQTLPLGFYKPIVHTLDTLRRIFGASILFTTASQPVLHGKIEGANPMASFEALSHIHEIIPKNAQLHNKLRCIS